MESICYKKSYGIAKIMGTFVCVAGALVYAFVNGPPLYPESHKKVNYQTSVGTSKWEWIKGSLIILLANTMWSLWLILQVFFIAILSFFSFSLSPNEMTYNHTKIFITYFKPKI